MKVAVRQPLVVRAGAERLARLPRIRALAAVAFAPDHRDELLDSLAYEVAVRCGRRLSLLVGLIVREQGQLTDDQVELIHQAATWFALLRAQSSTSRSARRRSGLHRGPHMAGAGWSQTAAFIDGPYDWEAEARAARAELYPDVPETNRTINALRGLPEPLPRFGSMEPIYGAEAPAVAAPVAPPAPPLELTHPVVERPRVARPARTAMSRPAPPTTRRARVPRPGWVQLLLPLRFDREGDQRARGPPG